MSKRLEMQGVTAFWALSVIFVDRAENWVKVSRKCVLCITRGGKKKRAEKSEVGYYTGTSLRGGPPAAQRARLLYVQLLSL